MSVTCKFIDQIDKKYFFSTKQGKKKGSNRAIVKFYNIRKGFNVCMVFYGRNKFLLLNKKQKGKGTSVSENSVFVHGYFIRITFYVHFVHDLK